jgi:hypothetical protein
VDSQPAVTVAVSRITGPIIQLNGGLAMNLHEGCELKRVAPSEPPVELRITRVNGLASSEAAVSDKTGQPASIHAGDLFELTKWVAPDQEQMRVFLGAAAPKEEIHKALTVLAELHARSSAAWITDPTEQTPTHILSWDADRSKWSWKDNHAGAVPVWLDRLTAETIARLLAQTTAKPLILAWIPSPPELTQSLRFGGNIAVVKSPALADYVLLGRPCVSGRSQCAEYAWVLPDIPGHSDNVDRPLRTNWVTDDEDGRPASGALEEAALGLARILGWSRLRSPEVDNSWPYHLALQNTRTKSILDSHQVKGGECYKALLEAAPGAADRDVQFRRVYVFAVDSFGKATLLFGNNLENEFPRFDATSGAVPETIPLSNRDCDFEIAEPYGMDHYFLLASATAIDSPETVFNFDGVRTRGGEQSGTNPLAQLLQNTATGRRGSVANIPVYWSIQKLRLVSRPPGSSK